MESLYKNTFNQNYELKIIKKGIKEKEKKEVP